mgnify:CR=1 FL=1
MENTTPFADAINGQELNTAKLTQINILRNDNYKFKLEIIELKLKLEKHSKTLESIESILRKREDNEI